MAYAMYVAAPKGKRLKTIDDKGVEVYEQIDFRHWVEVAHPTEYKVVEERAVEDAKPRKEDSEKSPTPAEAIEKIQVAMGELDIILDVVNTLEGQQLLAVNTVGKLGKSTEAIQEYLRTAVKERVLRLGRRQASLRAVAARLREGANGLRVQMARENSFYQELAKLQRYWKVVPGQQPDRPFTIDLAYGRMGADLMAAVSGRSGGQAAATVDVIRDSVHGIAVVAPLTTPNPVPSTEPKPEEPKVAVGVAAAHRLLHQEQRRLLWALLREELLRDAQSTSTNLLATISRMVVEALENPSEPRLAVLRPMMLEYFVSRVVAISSQQREGPAPSTAARQALIAGSAAVRAARKRNLLLDTCAWLAHMSWRHFVRSSLDVQATNHPGAILCWAPSWTNVTSVLVLHLGPGWQVLLLMRETLTLDVEGALGPPGSRWARDTHFSASKHDMPTLLAQIMAMAARAGGQRRNGDGPKLTLALCS